MAAFLSSGNMIVDTRLEWARGYWQAGDQAAAIDLLRQALSDAPLWVAGYFQLGDWCYHMSRTAEAVDAWRQCLLLDPRDPLGASVKLALLGVVPQPHQLPEAYVTQLFDDYAPRFETALLDHLDYQVPAQLHEAIQRERNPDHMFARVLDLGCGTGLAGQWIRPQAAHLAGVDLSPGMLNEARQKGLYDELVDADATSFLARHHNSFDLVMAADVLVYMGDLRPLFEAVADSLMPGGLFVASAEAAQNVTDYCLTAGHRFAHSADYIGAVCRGTGLEPVTIDSIVCRREAGADVAGWRLAAHKPQFKSISLNAAAEPYAAEEPRVSTYFMDETK